MWLLRLLRISAILTPIVPARAGYAVCGAIGALFYLINRRARYQVLDNLRRVEPNATWWRRQRDAHRVFITTVTNYYDLIRLRSVDRDRFRDLVDVHGMEHLNAALERGKGVIVLSAHLGNFSVIASYPVTLGYHAAVIAERVEPPELFRYLARLRSAMSIEVIPPGTEAIRPILRLLRRNHILLVAGDRDVVGHGMMVDFFGEPAALPVGPVLLAMRTGATLLPAYTVRLEHRKSIGFIEPPLELVDTGDWDADLRANMRIMARSLERMIAMDPGQWAVLQRIWGAPSDYFRERAEGIGGIPQVPSQRKAESMPGNGMNPGARSSGDAGWRRRR